MLTKASINLGCQKGGSSLLKPQIVSVFPTRRYTINNGVALTLSELSAYFIAKKVESVERNIYRLKVLAFRLKAFCNPASVQSSGH